MANTYTQIHVQIVFCVHDKRDLIKKSHREEIEKYITGIVHNHGHKLLAIYCMPDHVHILIGVRPIQSIADLVKEIKANSSRFITASKFASTKFSWQEGYGAFAYSPADVDTVIHYIRNQGYHHQRKTFREEYLLFLKEFRIDYNEKYLFDWIDVPNEDVVDATPTGF